MRQGHETFEHTADLGIRVWAGTLAGVFEEAAKALFGVIVDLRTVSPSKKIRVELARDSDEALFLAWLKELLFIFETEHLVFSGFRVLSLKSGALAAEAKGELLDNAKHALGREVKAITLHQFKLAWEKDRYLAEFIVDV